MIAVAFDFNDRGKALDLAARLQGFPIVIKLGLRLLPFLERGDIARFKDLGFKVFVDAKLHDIPTQVADAVKSWSELGADYITLHLCGGGKMLESAVREAEVAKVRLLGVSVLTSLNGDDLDSIGCGRDVATQVQRLAALGLRSGVRGFVSSVAELNVIQDLAKAYGETTPPTFCTPGLRFADEAAHGDQARSYSINEAARCGANLLVVGRSIVGASDPRAALTRALREAMVEPQ